MNEQAWLNTTQAWERAEQLLDTPEDMDWVVNAVVPAAKGKGYQSAVVYGDESNLSRVDFYQARSPTIDMAPDLVWFRE